MFDGKLGTIAGFTAELKLKENVSPRYFKPRPVRYALREKVENELKRLVIEGVLKKVESSDWTTPIVPVFTPDGTVRICGEFVKLNGGELFTNVDLSHAYVQ